MREWMKNRRTALNLTMKEAGAKMGVSESYYSMIESGKRNNKMDIVMAASIGSALEIPLDEVIKMEMKEER